MEDTVRKESAASVTARFPAGRFVTGYFLAMAWLLSVPADAEILWQHPQEILARDNGPGEDLLRGAIAPRDDGSSGALYIRFEVDPLADVLAEVEGRQPYLAGLVMSQTGQEKLGIGSAWDAWGYSAFCPTFREATNQPGEKSLRTDKWESESGQFGPYQAPRRGVRRTLIVKVDYFPAGEDLVTVWLDPNLTHGATERSQSNQIVTQFKADVSFDQIRVVHRGVGEGWIFEGLAVATAFEDFVPIPLWRRGWVITLSGLVLIGAVVAGVMLIERRRGRQRLQVVQQEQAVVAERVRIAQDLHDDLGAKVTEIVLLGELAKGDETGQRSLPMILDGLRQLHASLDEAVWSINPRNDSLVDLVEFVSDFAQRFLRHAPLEFRLEVSGQMPATNLSARQRYNVMLAVKETLNNAVRHAVASSIQLTFAFENERLCITVADDGRGFATDCEEGRGDGLRNIRSRLESIGGNARISSAPGNGTTVVIVLPLAPSTQASEKC